jgi:hypothetical protein
VLVNYTGKVRDVATIAHELGGDGSAADVDAGKI